MDSESKLISLITQLLFLTDGVFWKWTTNSKAMSLITQIISLVSSLDLNSLPKPESELMSLTTQITSLFDSTELDSEWTPLTTFLSLFSMQLSLHCSPGGSPSCSPGGSPGGSPSCSPGGSPSCSPGGSPSCSPSCSPGCSTDSNSNPELQMGFALMTLSKEILALEPEPKLMSLFYRVFSLVISMNSKSEKFISLRPQVRVKLAKGKFIVVDKFSRSKWDCLPGHWKKVRFPGEDATYFACVGCDGKNHEKYNKAPNETKHHLHRKHSLQLVLLGEGRTRECYCCDEDLFEVFYYCFPCNIAINMACTEKPPVLHMDHPKWHEHTLALFPRQASLACNLCGLADASSPIYMCPPCDFVVHLRCINLPRVIRISRHQHRISFTPSFDQGDLSCGVCRKIIDNDYGGYSCIKEDCSYVVHSRCATQKNVWDGKELEGEPEEEINEVEPFVTISNGIIQHFSHQHHHLRLDENISRDYDENKQCQACVMPIYFGNFYSCMQCNFILHEECANLSRNIHHPIHPHLLTLGYAKGIVVDEHMLECEACPRLCYYGFYYECSKDGCDFKLHVQCATILEPLFHESHTHPLFLTSKPEEELRLCSVCKEEQDLNTNETFNCIECDFALCFGCATLPQKVRYKHDKHILTLSYGKETSIMKYWCEACEGKIDPKERFYLCDEYCCVTLHIECLLGMDIYMEPGSSLFILKEVIDVIPNPHHMSRPICYFCEKRCPQRIVFQCSGSIFCSVACMLESASEIS